MKKTLSLLTLATLITSFGVSAQDMQDANLLNPMPTQIEFNNDASTGHATWVTIYNTIGRISDTACVQPGESVTFNGYMPPFSYEVRAEVTNNRNCGGGTIYDVSGSRSMSVYGLKATLRIIDGQYDYSIRN